MLFLAVRMLAALGLVFAAAHLHSAYLAQARDFAMPGLLGLAALLAAFSAYRSRRGLGAGRRAEHALLALCGLGVVWALAGEVRAHRDKQSVLQAEAAHLRELGRHFVIGYRRAEDIRPLAASGAIGGVFVTRRNLRGRSAAELRLELRALQDLRRAAGLPPLLVATDQEGGMVSRLSPPLSALPPLAEATASADAEEQISRARRYGEIHGRELAELGVTVNFAPVVDLRHALPDNPLDFHTLIAKRAISDDPEVVARVALAYSLGLEAHGVLATLKHFPGLGRVVEDTHHFSATLRAARAELDAADWRPFRAVLARSRALTMLGHVALAEVDAEHPASLSAAVVGGVIRGAWRHDGVLISDDLTMGAIYWRAGGVCRAGVQALNAGVDLLLLAYDWEQYYAAMSCALRARREGGLDGARLADSARRLAEKLPRARGPSP